MSTPSKALKSKKAEASPSPKTEIKEQIEYYLSDENLKHDSFFHEKISTDPKGYLDLDLLLKCNKIKNKGWTKEELKEGIKLSDCIELDKTGERVRRNKNKKLPELTLLSKKRKKETKKEDNKEVEEKEEKKDPIILKISSKEKCASSWKDIFEGFKKLNPDLDVEYGRFKDTEGHIGLILKKNQKFEDIKIVDKFKVGETEFIVERCEGEDLINFWKDHGSHYEYCTKRREKLNKIKDVKNKKQKKYLNKSITLGGKEYNNIELIKSDTKKILNKYKDDEKLVGEDRKFILDLLKYHHNYDEKVKDMDYIIVSKNEKFKFSRCFYIVDIHHKKNDFSSKKCIENLIETLNKENKEENK
jgi:hypothetical protein